MSTLTQQLEASVAMTPAVREEAIAPTVTITPMGMLQLAISKGADIDQLTKLMELQERFEANEARKAFNVAFSAFKAEAVSIVKRTEVKAGPLSGTKYANLYDVVAALVPALAKHGLSHSWKLTKDDKTWMEVTCTIRHTLGYSESVSMGSEPDTGPGRNSIQARGSAKNYLERYTFTAATGTAAANEDNDGNGAAAPAPVGQMDTDEFDYHMQRIDTAQEMTNLFAIFKAAYLAAQKAHDAGAEKQFGEAKEKRKKELA